MTLSRVKTQGDLFVDADGRQVMLRGVNLGGDCKVPWPQGGTNFPSDFSDHADVSFVGRPFPIEEADEHLGRLARWGFNCLRLLTTWEAVEHAGPGRYDEAYLDYFTQVCRKAGEHGIYLFVDFHQDVWSRMSGGDGAPGWTFDAVGLDFRTFDAAGAAHVMQAKYDYALGGRQASYPQMSWSSNYRLPANGIMWTLFWAGRWCVPDFRIDGENVQDVLQGHYLKCVDQVARRIAHLPNVLGFDTLNEPWPGWIGQRLSDRRLKAGDSDHPAQPGPAWSPLDMLAAARGLTVKIPILNGLLDVAAEQTVNANRVSIWRDGVQCPFEQAGIYELRNDEACPLNEDAFSHHEGHPLRASTHAYAPLFRKIAETTRRHQPEWSVFAEIDAGGAFMGHPLPDDMPPNSVNANHWYDLSTLAFKRFDASRWTDLLTGRSATNAGEVRAAYIDALKPYLAMSARVPGGCPTLIGEFGVPFDMNGARAYDAWARGERGDEVFASQAQALSLMYDAMDELLLHSTQWNYTASNSNDLAIGDGWNQEDLSIWSADQVDQGYDGGRAKIAFSRPYVQRAQGRLRAMRFDADSGQFSATVDADPSIESPTEIYVPAAQYPDGFDIDCDAVVQVRQDPEGQWIFLKAHASGSVRIALRRR